MLQNKEPRCAETRIAPHDGVSMLCSTLPGAHQMTCILCNMCAYVRSQIVYVYIHIAERCPSRAKWRVYCVHVCVCELANYLCVCTYCSTFPGALQMTCILCSMCAYVRSRIIYVYMHIAKRCQAHAKWRVYCAVCVHMWDSELFMCMYRLLHVARRAPNDVWTV